MISLVPFIGPLIDLIKGWQQNHHDEKVKQKELDDAAHDRQLKAIMTAETYDQAITLAQIDKASWKDEWFTILFSIPLVCAFFPSMVPAIMDGFAALDKMPVYYKAFLGSAVTAAFGLRVVDKAWKWWQSP